MDIKKFCYEVAKIWPLRRRCDCHLLDFGEQGLDAMVNHPCEHKPTSGDFSINTEEMSKLQRLFCAGLSGRHVLFAINHIGKSLKEIEHEYEQAFTDRFYEESSTKREKPSDPASAKAIRASARRIHRQGR